MASRVETLGVAKRLESVRLERLPPLIIDECLIDCSKELANTADMILSGRISLPHETLAMPRKKFGPRPVTISSTAARVAYAALVEHLGDSLGPKSREDGNWETFKSFAIASEAEYIVKFDIASYYEYIDHQLLAQQVLAHTLNPESTEQLRAALGSVIGGIRGLPQLLSASDHLSDTYIGKLERRLIRDGYSVLRFADDFTAACESWETANVIIERAAEYARDLGLVLSSEKTNISKRATLILAEQSEAQFINDSFEAAKIELSQVFLWGDYGEAITKADEPDDRKAMTATMWSLLHGWLDTVTNAAPEDSFRLEGHYRTFIPGALGWLRGHDQRVPERILQEIVFKHPLFLGSVCGYVSSRAESAYGLVEDPWTTIRSLTAMGRQSPWAKLWLLDTVSKTRSRPSWNYEPVMAWVDRQLEDRHEAVRAQAAWAAACHSRLSEQSVTSLYTRASPISQPALSACAAKQGTIGKGIVNSVKQDGPTMKKAYEWAEKQQGSKA
ncbi:reverse transcriptase domain-containing protein [[Kitasatospora] papulosa]|uniref:reverse transcriptase domain-containing protein n=1 Tax=[Kitasatospora] papulosa TaxID=1464011 RepID=UPI0036B98437